MKMKISWLKATVLTFVISAQFYAQDPVQLCAVAIEDGHSVELQFKVTNFDNIGSYQFAAAWDQNQYSFDSVGNMNVNLSPVQFGDNVISATEDIELIRSLWFDSFAVGKSLSDDEVLYSVYLTNSAPNQQGFLGVTDDINFVIEFSDGDGKVVEHEFSGENCLSVNLSEISTSVHKYDKNNVVQLMGNPIQENLVIQHNPGIVEHLMIYSIQGKLLKKFDVQQNNQSVYDLSSLPNGLYIAMFYDTDFSLIEQYNVVIQK